MPSPLQPTRAPRVTFTGATIAYVGNRQLTCSGGDISSSGVLLYPPERAARPGQFVRLIFTMAQDWIEADAVLVREAAEKSTYAWGLRFLQMSPHHSAELQRYIHERLAKEPPQARPSKVRMGGAAGPPPPGRPPPARRFELKDVTPIDEVERRKAESFGDDETPVRELYREALTQLDRQPPKGKGKRRE